MATNTSMDSVPTQLWQQSKNENVRTWELKGAVRYKKWERQRRMWQESYRKGSQCLQKPYFITQHQSLGGNQAYLAITPPLPHTQLTPSPTPKQLLLPSFLLCFAMGKMNCGTYQLNAYTSDWDRGHVGVHTVCVSLGMRRCLCLCSGALTTGGQ